MLKLAKTFVGLWAAATVVMILMDSAAGGGNFAEGLKTSLTPPKLHHLLAEGFYYGALCLGLMALFNRKKRMDQEADKPKAATETQAEGAGTADDKPADAGRQP